MQEWIWANCVISQYVHRSHYRHLFGIDKKHACAGETQKQIEDMFLYYDKCKRVSCIAHMTDHILKGERISWRKVLKNAYFYMESFAYVQLDHGHINVYKVSTFSIC